MAQRSNRDALVEGARRCLERLPPRRVTARAIAEESGANLASIAYHFGSLEKLVTEAVVTGLDRWLQDVAAEIAAAGEAVPAERLRVAGEAVAAGRAQHAGLARMFAAALAMAQDDPEVAAVLAEGFAATRPVLAGVLGLGRDRAGEDAAALVHSMFTGLLLQSLLDPGLAVEGERLHAAQVRLRGVLPG